MAKFVLFGKLRKPAGGEATAPAAPPAPVERAKALVAQGYSETDVIKTLKGEGYSFEQIDEALSVAMPPLPPSAPSAEALAPPEMEAAAPAPETFEFAPAPREEGEEFVPMEEAPVEGEVAAPAEKAKVSEQYAEEIIETLIEEKISAVKEKFVDLDGKLKQISDNLVDLSKFIDTTESSLKEVRAEASRNIEDVNAKLAEIDSRAGSLERAFKEIIPNLVDSVREVREIVSRFIKPGAPIEV